MKFFFCFVAIFLLAQPAASSIIDKIDKGVNARTDILAIYKDGVLLKAEYRRGYTGTQKHKMWSMSKSVTSLLLARAVKEGRLSLQDSICDHIPLNELNSVEQCHMTIDDILFWQSGTSWSETYFGFDISNSNVMTGLYGEGGADFATYYKSLDYTPEAYKIGWNYSTGDSHFLSYLLKKVYSPLQYKTLPWDLLFDPIGLKDVTFETDHHGLFLGGSYIYMSQEDLNRVAQFILSEIKKPKLLPQAWFDHVLNARQNAQFNLQMVEDEIAPAIPGGHFWLNRVSNSDIQERPWQAVPEDTFAAFGVFGQMMFMVPSENLVVIRLSSDIKGGFDRENMLKIVMNFVKGRS